MHTKITSYLNEYNEPIENMPPIDRLLFIKNLKIEAEKILPLYSDKFNVVTEPGKSLYISTDYDYDLTIKFSFNGNKIQVISIPTKGVPYEYNRDFSSYSVKMAIDAIKMIFKHDPNNGILSDKDDTSLKSKTPIKKTTKKTTKKIAEKTQTSDINPTIIYDVLEKAFVKNEIELNTITLEDLINRMKIINNKL